jgi:Protein of unknown function (DUF3383)
VYDAVRNRFVMTSGTTGPSSSCAFMIAAGAGTDITAMLGTLSTSGGYLAPGLAAETALSAVELFDTNFGGLWYHNEIPDAVDSDWQAVCPFVDASTNPHFEWITSSEALMLTSGDETNVAYLLQQLTTQHAFVQYSSQNSQAAWSAAARFATVDYSGDLTAISIMYKTEPGVVPENLTETEVANLESYDANVFVEYSDGNSIVEQGTCPSGQFCDTIIGVDGLRTQIATNVWNLLLAAPKIPQTDPGVVQLETGVESACKQYIENGIGAPGVWNAAGFGIIKQGSFLSKGYYIFAPSVNSQTEATRAARVCPPMQIAFKLAGAIDTVSGTIFVNQ